MPETVWYDVCNDYSLERRATVPDLTGYSAYPYEGGTGWWEDETDELHYFSKEKKDA